MLLDLLSLPTSRRDWAVLISIVSFAVGVLALVLGDIDPRSLVAAGALGGAIVLSIVSVLIPRPIGIPLCVVSGLSPFAGLYFLLAPQS